jgi:hypothetical protein
MNNTAVTIKPNTIIVSVDNPPNISTPFSPVQRRHPAPEALYRFASEKARERRRCSITTPKMTTCPALASIGKHGPNRSLFECPKVTEEDGKAETGLAETPAWVGDKKTLSDGHGPATLVGLGPDENEPTPKNPPGSGCQNVLPRG